MSAPAGNGKSTLVSHWLEGCEWPYFLALDDYHHIQDTVIHDLLDELMRHPPQSLHLVLITRRDPPLPLAIFRAKAKMTEVRVQHLRLAALSLGHREDFNRVLTDLPDNNRYAIDIPPSASSASSSSIWQQ